MTPGHEVVGIVDRLGAGCARWREGDRIGVPWLAHTCGVCRFCATGRENLCIDPRFTGWDVDGGYAEYAVVDEAYAYALPDAFGDEEAAPLLCAGIIGYRALQRANLPEGGRLGIYGFGGSAHITAQVALARGARVHVMTRSPEAQALALELGVASAGGDGRGTARAARLGHPVRARRHARAAGAGRARPGRDAGHRRHLPERRARRCDYQEHLFEERTLQSVTANTRHDGEAFLAEAARIGSASRPPPIPWPVPTRRCATWPTTGSTGPPSWSPEASGLASSEVPA